MLSLSGTELSIYSVCAELRSAYTQHARKYVLLLLRIREIHLKIGLLLPKQLGRRVQNLRLYRVCAELRSAFPEYKVNYVPH
jgi:hypothetical protein